MFSMVKKVYSKVKDKFSENMLLYRIYMSKIQTFLIIDGRTMTKMLI